MSDNANLFSHLTDAPPSYVDLTNGKEVVVTHLEQVEYTSLFRHRLEM